MSHMNTSDIWEKVDAFLLEHKTHYNMSFGMEYNPTEGWVVDFTPRANHPGSRNYGLWRGQSMDREEAVRLALTKAREGIFKHIAGIR